jgi:hypothetical protein
LAFETCLPELLLADVKMMNFIPKFKKRSVEPEPKQN